MDRDKKARQAFTVYRHPTLFIIFPVPCNVSDIQDSHLITSLSQFTVCVQVTLKWWRLWEIHSQ